MQCNALCLYRVCVAGSNGSWCGWVRVLLCSRAETGHRGGCGQPRHKDCNQQKGPNFCLSVCLSLYSFQGLTLKKKKSRIERNPTEEVRAQPWTGLTLGLAQPLCNELTCSINKSTCRNVLSYILLQSDNLVTTMMLC